MVELRVDVPDERVLEFERFIARIGAKVLIGRQETVRPPLYSETMPQYQAKIDALRTVSDSSAGRRSLYGYVALLLSANDRELASVNDLVLQPEEYRDYWPDYLSEEKLPALRDKFVDKFLECVDERTVKLRGESMHSGLWNSGVLSPREVEFLIETYGLASGTPHSLDDIRKMPDVKGGRTTLQALHQRSLRTIRDWSRNLTL